MEEISKCAAYDISFDSSCYAVAVIKIDNVSNCSATAAVIPIWGRTISQLAAVIISNIMQEIISSEMTALIDSRQKYNNLYRLHG